MIEESRDEQSLMDVRAKTGKNRRERSVNTAHCGHNDGRKKRRRFAFSSETTIPTSSEPQKLPSSKRSKPVGSPSRTSRKYEKRRSGESDGHRLWVYSTRDCSRFIGNGL